MSGIAFQPGAAPAPSVQPFDRSAYRRQGGTVFVGTRPVGTIVTHGDLRTFVSRRHWDHVLRKPERSWAFAEELLAWLQTQDVGWLRVECHGGKGGPIAFNAPLTWLLEPPSFAVHHPPHERQRGLSLSEWLVDTPASLARDADVGLFGRPLGGKPA